MKKKENILTQKKSWYGLASSAFAGYGAPGKAGTVLRVSPIIGQVPMVKV
jgi:hypothetical protein